MLDGRLQFGQSLPIEGREREVLRFPQQQETFVRPQDGAECPAHWIQQRSVLYPAATFEDLLGDALPGAQTVKFDAAAKTKLDALAMDTACAAVVEMRAGLTSRFVDGEQAGSVERESKAAKPGALRTVGAKIEIFHW